MARRGWIDGGHKCDIRGIDAEHERSSASTSWGGERAMVLYMEHAVHAHAKLADFDFYIVPGMIDILWRELMNDRRKYSFSFLAIGGHTIYLF